MISMPPVGSSGARLPWAGSATSTEAPLLLLSPPEPAQPEPIDEPKPVPPPAPAPPEPPKPREITLGTADSQSTSRNWLPSNQGGEHSAPESTVEQPALKLTDRGGAPGTPVPPRAKSSPTTAATPPQTPTSQSAQGSDNPPRRSDPSARPGDETRAGERDAEPIDRPEGPAQSPREPVARSAAQARTPRGAGVNSTPNADSPKSGEANAPDREAEPTDLATRPMIEARGTNPDGQAAREPADGATAENAKPRPVDAPGERATAPVPATFVGPIAPEPGEPIDGTAAPLATPNTTAANTPPNPQAPAIPAELLAGEGGDGLPDEQAWVADREADPSSIRRAVKFQNGKVEAGKGLDIRTVRPRFTLTSKALARPLPPVVEAAFDFKGEVRSVRFLRTSGYEDVDAAIEHAVWQWKASGEVLGELKDEPRSRLRLRITFVR